MATCPKCGELVSQYATYCSNCGSPLQPQGSPPPPYGGPSTPSIPRSYRGARVAPQSNLYFIVGIVCAIAALLVFPEVLGPIAIVLGAYTWKEETVSNRGRSLVFAGLACTLVGYYVTALLV